VETACVLLVSDWQKLGTSNLETFPNELEACQIDVTEDFKPEPRNQAATPWPESAERGTSLDVSAQAKGRISETASKN
jgi:hypothetical protein